MKHNINYKILTLENSYSKIDHFSLKYAYIYILKNSEPIDLENTQDNFVINNDFKFKNDYYLIFWAKTDQNNFTINSNSIQNLKITHFLFKPEDSYVFGINKQLNHIDDVLDIQYTDLTFKKYHQKQVLSSPLFNIITSNKVLYHHHFIDKKLIINSQIKHLNVSEINNYPSNYIVKAPYSSGSSCIKIKNKIPEGCYLDDGVIVSKINYTGLKFELKIHVIQSKIVYCVIKNSKNKIIILDSDLKLRNSIDDYYIKDIINQVNQYKSEIIKMVNKVYQEMNELLYITKYKLDFELQKFIKPLKLNKSIFYNVNPYTKIKVLEYLIKTKNKINNLDIDLVKKYIKFLNLSTSKLKKLFKLKIKESNYTEKYMRIDLMLPDNINYNSVSLLEIEPFACGKGFILNIRNSIDILSNKYIPDSAQSLVFTKYFQTLLEEKYEFNWYKISHL